MGHCCGLVKRSEFHCARCHETFGTLVLFDAHQIADYQEGVPVRPVIICRDPAVMTVAANGRYSRGDGAVRLAQDGRGTWRTPAGLAVRERQRERAVARNQRRPST